MVSFLNLWFSWGQHPGFEDYAGRKRHPDSVSGGYRIYNAERGKYRDSRPLVSIITVVRNGERTLERTIESVLKQTYSPIEYILIDGASTDASLQLIQKYGKKIAYWISEPDGGIYDAFNKGVAACSGEFIGILNADDWMSEDQISNAVDGLCRTGADFVHGNIYYHKKDGEKNFRLGDLNYFRVIPRMMTQLYHTTILCRKDVFSKAGLFRTQFRIAGDYDWFIRITKKGFKGAYIPEITGHMEIGGISTTCRRSAVLEGFIACVKNGYPLFPSLLNWGRWFVFIDGEPAWFNRLFSLINGFNSKKLNV